MTAAQLIQVLIPTIGALIVYLYHLIFYHLPQKQQEALDRFAPRAVGMVQQVYGGGLGEDKKATAGTMVKKLLKERHLPKPSEAAISTIIQDVVYVMKQGYAPISVTTKPATRPSSIP